MFQLSFKQALGGTGLYFGYTQISFWQAYDVQNSSPFRGTDYNPDGPARSLPLAVVLFRHYA
ncbi:MAG: phospholipase A [bacterium]|nr:phospholipase A [bacterium]